MRAPRILAFAFVAFPAVLLAFGIVLVLAGLHQAPRDDVAAQAFRDDPSCDATMTMTAADGCSVVAASIVSAEMRHTGSGRARSGTAFVSMRFADGTTESDALAGADGRTFVDRVYPGDAARAQRYHGKVVRLASGAYAAETFWAPDVVAASDSALPWVGGGLAVVASLFGWIGWRVARRIDAVR